MFIWIFLGLIALVLVVFLYCCCVIAGRVDDEMNQR